MSRHWEIDSIPEPSRSVLTNRLGLVDGSKISVEGLTCPNCGQVLMVQDMGDRERGKHQGMYSTCRYCKHRFYSLGWDR